MDDDLQKNNTQIFGFPVIGSSADLEAIVIREQISDIVVAISGVMQPEMFSALLRCAENSVDITTMPVMYEELLGRVPIFLLQSDWLLRTFLDQARSRGFYEPAKRLVDILVCAGWPGRFYHQLTPLLPWPSYSKPECPSYTGRSAWGSTVRTI